jgi:predicted small secreted protein
MLTAESWRPTNHRAVTAALPKTAECEILRQERKPIMKRKLALIFTLLALVGTAPLLSACYTTAGAGQDLQAAGKGLERSADRNTGYRP